MELIREREAINRSTGERHEVEPENFQKVVEQMQIPAPEENVVEFTPNTDLNEFIQRLK